MKYLIAAILGVALLAGIFHEDVARYWAQHGPHVASSGGNAGGAGRLGGASRRSYGGIGRSVGGN